MDQKCLEEYRYLLTAHRQMKQRMEEQQFAVSRLMACRRTDSTSEKALTQAVGKREQLFRGYCALDEQIVSKLSAIEKAIASLPQREQVLLRLRYIDGLSGETVCRKMGYSRRQISRIHEQALRLLAAQAPV